MGEELRVYMGTTAGLRTLTYRPGKADAVGEFFSDKAVEAIATDLRRPNVAFAGLAFDGAYRTQDGGQSWQRVLEGDVRSLAVDPSDERVVYAGVGPIQLLRSEDGGTSWEPLDGLLDLSEEARVKWDVPVSVRGKIPPHVRDIFINPDDANLLYLALEHGGVVRSRDRGESWEDVTRGISYPDMHHLGSYPGSKESMFVSSARGFFRTDDASAGWKRTEEGMPWAYTEDQSYAHDWLYFSGDPPRMLLAGANGSPGFWNRPSRAEGVLMISDDLGESWTQVTSIPDRMNMMAWALTLHPTDPDSAFAGMGDQSRGFGFTPGTGGTGAFYVTRDRGDSWEALISDLPTVLVIRAVPIA
jgi:photosystem II stability/assembly factor-like uncharacterized protein